MMSNDELLTQVAQELDDALTVSETVLSISEALQKLTRALVPFKVMTVKEIEEEEDALWPKCAEGTCTFHAVCIYVIGEHNAILYEATLLLDWADCLAALTGKMNPQDTEHYVWMRIL